MSPVTNREFHMVLHLPAFPPVEVSGDQAEGEVGEAAQNQLDEKRLAFPLDWEEEREKVVENSFQNAGQRWTQLLDSVEAAQVDPSGDDKEGVEDVGSALPGEAKEEGSRSKEGSLSDAKGQQPERKEAARDVIGCEDRCPLTGGVMKTGKVGAGTVCDVEHPCTAETGHLKDEMSIFPLPAMYLKSSHSRMTVKESNVGKVMWGGAVQDLHHDLYLRQTVFLGS